MKQFFKFFFASLFGSIVAFILVFAILVGLVGTIASFSKSDKEIAVKENSVLYMDLKDEISDRASNNPLENFDFGSFESNPKLGLNEILENIDKAARDERIKGIFLDLMYIQAGLASQNEIRNALVNFKDSGKFIVAYGDVLTQNAYYLASVADKIYLHPGGLMELAGLSAQRLYLKGTLDKLEIDMQVIRHGKFKSAVEPFTRENMSEASRLQTQAFVNSLWGTMVDNMGKTRNLTSQQLNSIANKLETGSPEGAVKLGLIDGVKYRDEVLNEIKEMAGQNLEEDLLIVKHSKYVKSKVKGEEKGLDDYKNKVAVIYASGEIQYGESDNDVMGSKTISDAIKKAREDENVKALVLRVNSPGGSSLASDIIWREVELTKEVKPVVVSMGNLAASGGYYIACGANRIIADEHTITGSIGVFGLVPNAGKFFKNKLGMTFDTVNTNTYSDMGSGVRPLKALEKQYIVNIIERIYDDFVSKVAAGRSMSYADVDSIGQGRVWSGNDALEKGLVDEIGGLERAIEVAAELGEVESYRILNLPEQKDPFQELLTEFTKDMEARLARSYFGKYFEDFNSLHKSISTEGIYMRMPYNLIVE